MSSPISVVPAPRHGHTNRVAIWQDYQEEAAALFRSVGLEATTDERLDGVRGAHDVDVVVRSRLAGLEQLWVVECKRRRRRVEKLHVTALAASVRDVGADRGVLLSEVGFQAGAVRMAYKSNVTLTSLAELREEAADELLMVRLGECRLRLGHLRERLGAVGGVRRHGGTTLSASYREAQGRWGFVKLHAAVSIAEEGLRRADMGRWPAPYAWDFASDGTRQAREPTSFIDGLTAALDELETELAAFEAVNA